MIVTLELFDRKVAYIGLNINVQLIRCLCVSIFMLFYCSILVPETTLQPRNKAWNLSRCKLEPCGTGKLSKQIGLKKCGSLCVTSGESSGCSPAVNWVNVPERRVLEDDIGDDHVGGVHELQQVRPCEGQRALLPHVPPHATLPINGAILTCSKMPSFQCESLKYRVP